MMNHNTNHQDVFYKNALLESVLHLLEFASIMGLLFCGLVLTHGSLATEIAQVAVYAIWFLISVMSVHLMQRGDRWGAYSLGAATLAVTFYDIIQGYGTLGGALLGILVTMIIIIYLRYTRAQ